MSTHTMNRPASRKHLLFDVLHPNVGALQEAGPHEEGDGCQWQQGCGKRVGSCSSCHWENNSEAAVQAVASPPARCDAAVQAVHSSPARAVASAEPALALTPHHGPAVQADGPLQVLLRQIQGEQYVTDAFCLDGDYFARDKKRKDDEERRKEPQADLDNIRRMIECD